MGDGNRPPYPQRIPPSCIGDRQEPRFDSPCEEEFAGALEAAFDEMLSEAAPKPETTSPDRWGATPEVKDFDGAPFDEVLVRERTTTTSSNSWEPPIHYIRESTKKPRRRRKKAKRVRKTKVPRERRMTF